MLVPWGGEQPAQPCSSGEASRRDGVSAWTGVMGEHGPVGRYSKYKGPGAGISLGSSVNRKAAKEAVWSE